MLLEVNGTKYECSICARTVIRFWQYFKVSFLDEWNEATKSADVDYMLKLLKQLVYASSNCKKTYQEFETEANKDKNFLSQAYNLKDIIFECNFTAPKQPDNGIPSDIVTFLANILICRIPDCWLDQFKYFELAEIINRKSFIENPDNYKNVMISKSELDRFDGITEERERSISEYIQAHPEEFK